MQGQHQLACGARRQIIGAGLFEVNDDARGGRILSVHPDAHALDPVSADCNAALPGRHYGGRQVHYHAGRLPETAADCSAAIDRGLRHAEVYFLRAIALDAAGQFAEAAADCSMALHLNPEHAGAYNSRGLVRGRLGRLDEALKDFSEAARLAPKLHVEHGHPVTLRDSLGRRPHLVDDCRFAAHPPTLPLELRRDGVSVS